MDLNGGFGVELFTKSEAVRAARSGNTEAFERLFRIYRPRVYQIARQYFAPGCGLEDLFQEATIGFFKAVRDFKEDRGMFLHFVDLCVRRQLITYIKSVTRQKHRPLNYATSLDAPMFSDSEVSLIERIAVPDNRPSHESLDVSEFLNALLARCSDLERDVLAMYTRGFSWKEMALELDVHLKAIDNAVWRFKVKARKLALESRFDHTYIRQVC